MGIYVKRNVVDKFCVEINEGVSERRRWCSCVKNDIIIIIIYDFK
jgi:hypothetical protein